MYENSQANGNISSGANLHTYNLFNDKYLYIDKSSDDPVINDVFYGESGGSGNGYASIVEAGGPNYYQGYGLNLYNYNTNHVVNYYYSTSNSYLSSSSPTSAGYIPLSPQVWNAQRGLAFNSSISGEGTILSPLYVSNTESSGGNSITQMEQDILPEVLSPNLGYQSTPITASAGYAPVAGAFATAYDYYTGKDNVTPPTTCGKKYVIFITFGQPTQATNGYVYPPLGSLTAASLLKNGGKISSASDWQSTNNAAVTDAITEIGKLYQKAGVKTYVLGVGSAVNPNLQGLDTGQKNVAKQSQFVLQAMATAGGTSTVYSAATSSEVQSALNAIVSNILGKSVVSSYAAPPTVTVGSLEFLLKNVNPVFGQGDLYAYPVTSTGALSTSQSWTANDIMSADTRSSALYTTPLGKPLNSGAPETFSAVASTGSAAFGALPTNLTAADIANYTINPSVDGGEYLGGRQNGWFVGLPANLVPAQVLTPPDNAFLLGNGQTSYATFAGKHSGRQNAVLFADNDGFLYALGYQNTGSPKLLWAWMPGTLLSQLKNYYTFWQGNNMGGFSTISASPDNGRTWHTYVVGVAQGGASIYDLQLSGTTTPELNSVVAQYSFPGYAQPVTSGPVFYQVQSSSDANYGTTWALFSLNTSSKYYLGILNVGTGVGRLVQLPFSNTATPYLDVYGDLFLGSASGKVYELPANAVQSLLAGTAKSLSSTAFTYIGQYAQWATSANKLSTNVQFIGGTTFQGSPYLRVQGPDGITIFRQSSNNWAPVWTTYAGGAGIWSGTQYTAQAGSASSSAKNYVLPLPAGAVISDAALIAAGNLIVPVSIPAPQGTCGYPTAAYYTFGLAAGATPSGAFVGANGEAFPQVAIVGRYNPYTPTLTFFNGRALLQGAAGQNSSGQTNQFPSAFASGLPLSGPVAWRLVFNQ